MFLFVNGLVSECRHCAFMTPIICLEGGPLKWYEGKGVTVFFLRALRRNSHMSDLFTNPLCKFLISIIFEIRKFH